MHYIVCVFMRMFYRLSFYYYHGKSKILTWYQIFIYFITQVKFHVVSHHRLQNCGSSSISSLQYLNMEQLMKTLASLYTLYEANHSSNSISENEAEFRSFYVLLHLDSKSQQRVTFIYWFCESISLISALLVLNKDFGFAGGVTVFLVSSCTFSSYEV